MAKLVPLFSGSQGNSYYLGCGGNGILIDVGRSAKQITAALKDNDIDISAIQAVFVTHEHTDHAKGVRVFANKHKIPVYATNGTLNAMKKLGQIDDNTVCRVIGDGVDLENMRVESFPISHDCAQGCGYRVTMKNAKFALATDLGIMTDEVKKALLGCDTVVIESNHDVRMLEMGPYPYILKRRIMSDIGHLSNEVCARFLPELVKSGTKRFVLAHLSRENNMPDIAYLESLNELKSNGMEVDSDFTLNVAPVQFDGRSVVF